MNRLLKSLNRAVIIFLALSPVILMSGCSGKEEKQPNILFAIADDWSWPHAGIAGAKGIETPAFDRVAAEGVLFTNAYCSAPSCTPSRGAILTGQYHWRLEEGGNLWSTLQKKFVSYPEILENIGYYTGYTGKGWSPGMIEKGGREENPAGKAFKKLKNESPGNISDIDYAGNFREFLKSRPSGQPFCFWYGSYEPHLPYDKDIGLRSGKNPEDALVPLCLPDNETVRLNILDYYFEIEWYDRHLGEMIAALDETGELENTIIICTSDNGMPFPRCKSNMYDFGTRMPLAIRWGTKVKGGRVVAEFVSLTDLSPTILEAAGLDIPDQTTGKSLMNILLSEKSDQVNNERNHVLLGKERHAWVRKGGLGYPMRAIRTKDFLYIINFEPDRWPAGDPTGYESSDPKRPYGDIDNSPTKRFMMENKKDSVVNKLYQLAFLKRPSEELYDLKKDPGQLENVAGLPEYQKDREKLRKQLLDELLETDDPRVMGKGDMFDKYPYYNEGFKPEVYFDSLAIYIAQGTMAGEVTETGVILQSRLTKIENPQNEDIPGAEGIARFEIDTIPEFSHPSYSSWKPAYSKNDFIVKFKVSDLKPGTRYYYRIEYGITGMYTKYGKVNSFTTLPGKSSEKEVSLVIVTGMNYSRFHYGTNNIIENPVTRMYTSQDKNLGYPALATITQMKPDYFIGTGDNVYYDSPKPNIARTKEEMQRKWHKQFAQPRYIELFSNVGTYWEKDDHDHRFNDCDTSGTKEPGHTLGKQVFLEQVPVVDPDDPKAKTYRTYRLNKNLQIWLPEGRDYRSPNTMPDGLDKSLWGKEQFAWLKETLLESDATFKILISPTPLIGPDDSYKTDNHTNINGFRYERDQFFLWLKENGFIGNNFFIACGDRHWQYHSIDPSGIEEFSCGALVDANSRAGRLPGDPESTDPEATIKQPYVQGEGDESGGFLHVKVYVNEDIPTLHLSYYDEKGTVLYQIEKFSK